MVGVSSLNKEVLLNPGETSHVGKHLSIIVLTSIREHGWMKLTLCTEMCIHQGPLRLRRRIRAYCGDCFRVRAVLRSVRSAEPRGKRAGKGELGGKGFETWKPLSAARGARRPGEISELRAGGRGRGLGELGDLSKKSPPGPLEGAQERKRRKGRGDASVH